MKPATAPPVSPKARPTARPTDAVTAVISQPLPSQPPPADPLHPLLDRPRDQRLREYQYRFAQSAVFGLPVLALHLFGRSLGGTEASRWVAILQAALAGWVIYVGAAGMLFEGLLLLARRRFTADLLPALAAIALYVLALWRTVPVILHSASPAPSPPYHLAVLTLILWTGFRWWQKS